MKKWIPLIIAAIVFFISEYFLDNYFSDWSTPKKMIFALVFGIVVFLALIFIFKNSSKI